MSIGRNPLITKLTVYFKRKGALKVVTRWLLETGRTLYIRLTRLFRGIDRDKIVFSSLMARSYSDNLKPISECLHEMRPQAKIVWMFRDPEGKKGVVPDYVIRRDPISLAGLREYATARVWVDNFTLGHYLKRRIGSQFYINTWHGDRAFKKIAYDAFPDQRIRIEETCDLVLAGSTFGEKMMRSAFRYSGDMLVAGSPRNDCLVNYDPQRALKIREKLNIAPDTKLLIYCPTFRDALKWKAFENTLNLEQALDDLERVTGEKWECLFRAHHLALGGLAIKEGGRLRDVTSYEDMADLLQISDALLTDYSSAAMDFCLLEKPIFLYQDDVEDYTTNNRQLYHPMEELPFLVAHNQAELTALIEQTDSEKARENCRAIMDFYGFRESGEATRRVCERIIRWMENA